MDGRIVIDHKPTYSDRGDDDETCETTSASTCSTTFPVRPSTTQLSRDCYTVTGCKVTDTTTATITSACGIGARHEPTHSPSKRAPIDDCGKWAFVYVVDNTENDILTSAIKNAMSVAIGALHLEGEVYISKSPTFGVVSYALEKITDAQIATLKDDSLERTPVSSAFIMLIR